MKWILLPLAAFCLNLAGPDPKLLDRKWVLRFTVKNGKRERYQPPAGQEAPWCYFGADSTFRQKFDDRPVQRQVWRYKQEPGSMTVLSLAEGGRFAKVDFELVIKRVSADTLEVLDEGGIHLVLVAQK